MHARMGAAGKLPGNVLVTLGAGFIADIGCTRNLRRRQHRALNRRTGTEQNTDNSNAGIGEVWVALVSHLVTTGQSGEAEAVIAEAARRLPPGQAPLYLARCHELVRRFDRAGESYRKALERSSRDILAMRSAVEFYQRLGQSAQAEQQLRRLLEAETAAPEEDLAWARRQLALLLVGNGDSKRWQEALSLIDQNGQIHGTGTAQQRTRAYILGQHPEHREEAIALLENSAKAKPLAVDELFHLAQLQEANGDLAKARERLVELLSMDGRNASHLFYYANLLRKLGEGSEADRWLARAGQLGASSSGTQIR